MSIFARTSGGDWVFPLTIVTDPGIVAAQKANDSLNLWQGSWFADVTIGFPWLQRVLGRKAATAVQTRDLLRQAILAIPNVVSILDLLLKVGSNRQLSYSFRAKLNTGQVLSGGSGQPFVVTGSAAN